MIEGVVTDFKMNLTSHLFILAYQNNDFVFRVSKLSLSTPPPPPQKKKEKKRKKWL